jgi:protein-L-isoaspartate(D-aspartate) O-methyltransferase
VFRIFTITSRGAKMWTLTLQDRRHGMFNAIIATAGAWSGLTIPHQTAWSDLYLWLSALQPGFCRLDQISGPQLARGGPVMKTGWFPFAIAHQGTLSYVTTRDLPDGTGSELGAIAYGHRSAEAVATLVRHLKAWDAFGRNLPQDAFVRCPPPSGLRIL